MTGSGWQGFVDQMLEGGADKAAIIGQQGGVWAASEGFTPSADDQQLIRALFDDPEQTRRGFQFASLTYHPNEATEFSVYANTIGGGNGVALRKTKQGILVAMYGDFYQWSGRVINTVEILAEYLMANGD